MPSYPPLFIGSDDDDGGDYDDDEADPHPCRQIRMVDHHFGGDGGDDDDDDDDDEVYLHLCGQITETERSCKPWSSFPSAHTSGAQRNLPCVI